MKEVLTIHHADNGIIIKYDEYVEVVEYTHNADGKDKDNLYQRLGRTFYNLVTNAMDAEITNRVQVEINITKAE